MSVLKVATSVADLDYWSTMPSTTTANSYKAPSVSEGFSGGISDPEVHFQSTATLWLHFFFGAAGTQSHNYDPGLQFYDSAYSTTQPLFRVNTTNVEYWNGTAWTELMTIPVPPSSVRVDVKIVLSDTVGVFEVFYDGVSQALHSGDTLFVAATGIDRIRMNRWFYSTSVFSEVIVADEDTRDMRLLQALVNGAGAQNDWVGTYVDIDEVGFSADDMISSDAAGELFLATKAAMPTGYGSTVKGLFLSGRARVVGTGPTNLEGAVRVGATNYFSAAKGINGEYGAKQLSFLQNPSTLAAWTLAEIDAAEVGLRSQA